MLLKFLMRHRTAFATKKNQSYMFTVPRLRNCVQKQRILLLKCGKEEMKILSDFRWVRKIPAYQ